jgi:sulfatase maturation enzyme AslB (radical SAM superfamily)
VILVLISFFINKEILFMGSLINAGPISQLVLQPTPFCNLSCSYCYLTKESRASKSKMTPLLAQEAVLEGVFKPAF